MTNNPETDLNATLTQALRDATAATPGSDLDAVVRSALARVSALPDGARRTQLLARASAIHTPRARDLVHLIVAAVGRQLRVLRVDAEILSPVAVRGAAPDASDGVMVRQKVGPFNVATHIASAGNSFAVSLDLLDGDAEETRVTLLRAGRELASELPRRGRVFFDALPAGHYQVLVEDRTGAVAELDLALERAAA